jgi:hypothetical protein
MATLRDGIVPKSDQLNYDDVMSTTITAVVERVVVKASPDQPWDIYLQGYNRPYKPCLGMRRILFAVWGDDETKWPGNALTIFGNPKVRWAGKDAGGIQISHLTGLTAPLTVSLTIAKGKREPFTVQPLQMPEQQKQTRADACRQWLAGQGIAVSDALAMIGKNSLEEATQADFARIGKMKAEVK